MEDLAAMMRVPEAAVDENDLLQPGKDKVRATRELAIVQTVTKPHSVYEPSHNHLRLRILAADSPHVLASLGRR